MPPPSYADLSKDANDLYNKDFTFGMLKAELKTKAEPFNTEIRTSGSHDIETARVSGEVEVKHVFEEHGVTVTRKLKTPSVFVAEVAVEDRLVEGLKNAFEATLDAGSGNHSAKVKTAFKRPNANAAFDLEFKGAALPGVATSAVFGYRNFLVGSSVAYDVGSQKLTKLSYGGAYQVKDFSLQVGMDTSNNSLSANAYQRFSPNLAASGRFAWSTARNNADFGAAVKYCLGGGSFAKARLDNRGLLGTAYSVPVRDGFRLTLCSNLDLKNLNGGGHQLGMAVSFEP